MKNTLSEDEKNFEQVVRPSVGYWADAWRRLKNNKVAIFSLGLIILSVLLAIFGPIFMEKTRGYNYYETNLQATNLRPSLEHWFGTDDLGRDLFMVQDTLL